MAKYDIKNAIVDLGFVDGYLRTHGGGVPLFESMWDALDRIETAINTQGRFVPDIQDAAFRRALHGIGFIRGTCWTTPLHDAYSEAMDRLIEFFVEGAVDWYQLPQPWRCRSDAPEISDEQRDTINGAYLDSPELAADEAGIPIEVVERATHPAVKNEVRKWQTQAAAERRPEATEPSVSAESTPEQLESPNGLLAALISEKPDEHVSSDPSQPCDQALSDDQIDEVRTMAATMTDEEIGRHYRVSRDTVIRFRRKHGIIKSKGPRQGHTRYEYGWEPWQKQKLREMKLAGAFSWKQIGDAIGKTPNQCSGMWHWEKKKLDKADEQGPAEGAENDMAADELEVSGSEESESGHQEEDPDDLATDPVPEAPAPHRLTAAHPGYAGMRGDGQLVDSDWPDIKEMLAQGRERRSIASDFDTDLEDLEFFISSNQRREAKKPPGEARAPLPSLKGGAI